MDMVFPYKSEADLKAHIWSWRTKENMQREKRGYANRDNQSGITLDRKNFFSYTVKDFFHNFLRETTYQ